MAKRPSIVAQMPELFHHWREAFDSDDPERALAALSKAYAERGVPVNEQLLRDALREKLSERRSSSKQRRRP